MLSVEKCWWTVWAEMTRKVLSTRRWTDEKSQADPDSACKTAGQRRPAGIFSRAHSYRTLSANLRSSEIFLYRNSASRLPGNSSGQRDALDRPGAASRSQDAV